MMVSPAKITSDTIDSALLAYLPSDAIYDVRWVSWTRATVRKSKAILEELGAENILTDKDTWGIGNLTLQQARDLYERLREVGLATDALQTFSGMTNIGFFLEEGGSTWADTPSHLREQHWDLLFWIRHVLQLM